MDTRHSPIDTTLSVNEIIRRYPASLAVLNAAGIDTCCGGAESLAVAARNSGADLERLVAGIVEGGEQARSAGAGRR